MTRLSLKASLQIPGTRSAMYKYFNKFFVYHIVMAKKAFDPEEGLSKVNEHTLISATKIEGSRQRFKDY